MRMSLKSVVARYSFLLFVTWLAACPYSALGIIARSQSFQVQQPDGTVVTLQLRGDDRVRFDKDNDGYQVTKQKQQQSGKDIFVYATFNTSSQTVVATNKEVCNLSLKPVVSTPSLHQRFQGLHKLLTCWQCRVNAFLQRHAFHQMARFDVLFL
jgi:hypothetical protein